MRGSVRLYGFLEKFAGRSFLWRLGRFLYLGSRRELSNEPEIDGELSLQDWVVCHFHGTDDLTVWDVGANLGDWSSSIAQKLSGRRAKSRIFAFEPAPSQRAHLSALNTPPGIEFEVLDLALGANKGSVRFEVTGAKTGSSAIMTSEGMREPQSTEIFVDVSTVDEMMDVLSVERISLLKIDTEGNDHNVLLGAEKALSRKAVDVIQFEYGSHWLRFGHSLNDSISLAHKHGYLFGKLTPHEIEKYSEWHPELDRFILANFVLICPHVASSFPVRAMTFNNSNVAVAERD